VKAEADALDSRLRGNDQLRLARHLDRTAGQGRLRLQACA
jgi:hypothetical protein